ncbi:hypothetical protein QI260_05910 [Staphylococcus saprophyticus]|nr:hypothetical protein [Staphylococcus saprophyticus]
MSQELFLSNISYLVDKEVKVKPTNEENAVIRQIVANVLAELNHKLSDDDIIFTYATDIDRTKLDPEDNFTTLANERVAVFTKNGLFIEAVYKFDTDSAFISQIRKRTIEVVKPIYQYVGEPGEIVEEFEEIDHLRFRFSDNLEYITLHSHEHSGNKTIKEIYLAFIEKLK